MTETALAPTNLPIRPNFSEEQIELIKRQIAKGASDDELKMFLQICRKTGLDPFTRQIYRQRRWDSKEQREAVSFQVSIDGMRLVAERTGEYEGQTIPQWCGKDAKWIDVWLSAEPPQAARVGVYRKSFREPVYGIARLGAYQQTKKDGTPTTMWVKMPDVMLAKCAESLALRKAFPHDLSGLYSEDEMAQATKFAPTMEVPASIYITIDEAKGLNELAKERGWNREAITALIFDTCKATRLSEVPVESFKKIFDTIDKNPKNFAEADPPF